MMFILFLSLLGVWVQRGDAKKLLFGLYFVLYLGVFLLWPFEEDSRFVLPVMPIAIVFFADGARAAWEGTLRAPRIAGGAASVFFLCAALTALWRPPVGRQEWISLMIACVTGFAGIVVLFARRAAEALERLHAAMRNRIHPLAMALVAVLLVLNLSGQVLGASENLHPDRSKYVNEPYRQASLWLLQAPPGNVMAGGCAMVHRYSRRPCFRFFPTSNPDRNLASIRRNAIRFLVVIRERKDRPPYYRPSEEERLKGLEGKEPELLRVIQEDRNFLILETDRSVWGK